VHGDIKPMNIVCSKVRLELVYFEGKFAGAKIYSVYVLPEKVVYYLISMKIKTA